MSGLIFGGGGIAAGIRAYVNGVRWTTLEKHDCDVRERIPIAAAFRRYEPDYVVFTAGVDNEAAVHDVIDTNLIGSLFVAQACAIRDIPCILIGSVAGLCGKPGHAVYSASKAGVISIVESLGFNYKIWGILPGRVNTKMRDDHYPNDTPGSRLEPEQIGFMVDDIFFNDLYLPGTNIIIRKIGLDRIEVEEVVNPWKEILNVGKPVTI